MAALSPWGLSLRLVKYDAKLFRVQVIVSALHGKHQLDQHQIRSKSSNAGSEASSQSISVNKPTTKAITISRAMRAYMEKVKAHNEMMKAEVADYEIGKRHLANIMGEDPDNFTQADVDRAIEYLLPSGIFEKKARPMMKNPYEIFPKKKAAQFGLDGRPYHWMYFTTLPNYYSVLYDIAWKMEDLKALEDKLRAENRQEEIHEKTINLANSEWLSLQKFKEKLVENIQEKEYNHFILLMERLVALPLSHREEDYIMQFRILLQAQSLELKPPEVQVDSEGRFFAEAKGERKSSEADVRVFKPGSGKVSINGKDILYFTNPLYRQSVMFPLSVTNLIDQVDFEAQVFYGGPTGQAGAVRLGLARALTAFVDDDLKEQLRLSGMLTKDPRTRERKKPGQEGARKKFTWKKR